MMKKNIIIITFIVALIAVMITSIYIYWRSRRFFIDINNNSEKTLLLYKADELSSNISEINYLFKKFYERVLIDDDNPIEMKKEFETFFKTQGLLVELGLFSDEGKIFSVRKSDASSISVLDLKDLMRDEFDISYRENYLNGLSINFFIVSPIFQVMDHNLKKNTIIIAEYDFHRLLTGTIRDDSSFENGNTLWLVNEEKKVVGSTSNIRNVNKTTELFNSVIENRNYAVFSIPYSLQGREYKLFLTIDNDIYLRRIITPKMIKIYFAINFAIIILMLISIPFFLLKDRKYKNLKREETLLKIKLDKTESQKQVEIIESSNFFSKVRKTKN